MIDPDFAWAAFERRDRSLDGRFVGAVKTTGIYCKPCCPARRPKRENVLFFDDGAAARAAGFRPCLRCTAGRSRPRSRGCGRAAALIEAAEEPPGWTSWPRRSAMRRTISSGCSPATWAFRRRLTAARVRARRAGNNLNGDKSVTEAIYDAGYAAPSRFYADAKDRLGMTPSAWRDGGRGETIRYAMLDTPLGADAGRGDAPRAFAG